MNETGNKTVMCSVLFLDIVEYSKKSVAGQISLKDRFNNYLSLAVRSVPIADRIILDTGDGAAVNFLGNIEEALRTALALREGLLNEAPDIDLPLLVRMGINYGPVRLVMDINGLPNVVGDGVAVAQSIMGFAESGQILVSRSYYDAVSRLSSRYAGMLNHAGLRTDKQVREHEIYAVGHAGSKAVQSIPDKNADKASKRDNTVSGSSSVRQGDIGPRVMYIVAIFIFLLLVGVLVFKFVHHGKNPVLPAQPAATAKPGTESVNGGKKVND